MKNFPFFSVSKISLLLILFTMIPRGETTEYYKLIYRSNYSLGCPHLYQISFSPLHDFLTMVTFEHSALRLREAILNATPVTYNYYLMSGALSTTTTAGDFSPNMDLAVVVRFNITYPNAVAIAYVHLYAVNPILFTVT